MTELFNALVSFSWQTFASLCNSHSHWTLISHLQPTLKVGLRKKPIIQFPKNCVVLHNIFMGCFPSFLLRRWYNQNIPLPTISDLCHQHSHIFTECNAYSQLHVVKTNHQKSIIFEWKAKEFPSIYEMKQICARYTDPWGSGGFEEFCKCVGWGHNEIIYSSMSRKNRFYSVKFTALI